MPDCVRTVLIGGEPGAGKSAALSVVIADQPLQLFGARALGAPVPPPSRHSPQPRAWSRAASFGLAGVADPRAVRQAESACPLERCESAGVQGVRSA